jgi:maltooligosyltrehalose trehalohydrolase
MKIATSPELRLHEVDSNLGVMNTIDVSKRKLGVRVSPNEKTTIVVWAPFAEKLEVVKMGDSSRIQLDKEERGYWAAFTDQLNVGDLYKIRINDKDEYPDPVSLSQPEGVHGPSQCIDLNDFQWTDHRWNNLPLNDYLIYELHTGTFTEEGTFAGIEQKIDHLVELGVTAIEIMPIAQFPGNRNWGYDGVFPFAVQNTYGGARALQHLVNYCHEKGLVVILDVVYNHLGPEGNYLGQFGPYFTDKYKTPWGSAINFDDAWCDGVRQYFIENVLMWFRDFHIDALRMDAVHAIRDFSPNHILREIKQQVNELMKVTGRTHYLIVELDLNDTKYINPLDEQGYGMDAQWVDEFHHALRVTAGEGRSGYYSDFEGINHLAKAYLDAYVYDGIYSPHRFKTFGVKTDKNPGKQFVVFSQNHDQVGNRMLGERTSELVSFEMQKLLAGTVLVSPFLPMLFMGEEWSESHPFQYFVSHSDPVLVEAVRNGRRAEFATFHAKGEAPDPQSEETFNNSKLQWDLVKKEPHVTMFRFYQELIKLRKQYFSFSNLDRKNVEVRFDEKHQTLLLHRWYDREHLVVLMNFSKEQQIVNFPAFSNVWQKLIASSDRQWKGPAHASEIVKGGSNIILQPESIIIYTNSHA